MCLLQAAEVLFVKVVELNSLKLKECQTKFKWSLRFMCRLTCEAVSEIPPLFTFFVH